MKKSTDPKPETSKATLGDLTDFQEKLNHQNSAILKLSALFLKGKSKCVLLFLLCSFCLNAAEIEVKAHYIIGSNDNADIVQSTNFGNVVLGSSDSASFEITNTTSGTLNLTKVYSWSNDYVEISGVNRLDFAVIENPYHQLYLGSSTSFKILFAPITGGTKKATVTIRSNSSIDSVFTFEIIGIGIKDIQNPIGSTNSQIGLTLKGSSSYEKFGSTVSMSRDGTTVAIAAPDGKGKVSIYRYNNGTLNQLGSKLFGKSSYDKFGHSISINGDGNIIAIGAPGYDSVANDAGMVTIYEYDNSVNDWLKKGNVITGLNANDGCGYAISLSRSGEELAILATPNNSTGSVRVFNFDGSNWVRYGQIITGEIYSIDLCQSGRILACGFAKAYVSGSGSNTGYVRLYQIKKNYWSPLVLYFNGTNPGEKFGSSVALSADGKRIAIGAPLYKNGKGRVKIYEFKPDYYGSEYDLVGKEIKGKSSLIEHFGSSISMSDNGEMVAIGGPLFTKSSSNLYPGIVRVYKQDTSGWTQLGSDIEGKYEFEYTGTSISLNEDGSKLAVGAPAPYSTNPSQNEHGEVKLYGLAETEIKLMGNGTEIETNNGSTLLSDFTLFMPANYDSDTTIRKFVIKNSGVKTLNLNSPYFKIMGQDSLDFKIIQNPVNSILPDSSTSFLIEFNPSSIGLKKARIEIYSTDANESEYELNVEGNGNFQIRNGGSHTTTLDGLTVSSSENAGFALQDVYDKIIIKKVQGTEGVNTASLPTNSIIYKRENRKWQISIEDADANGGQIDMSFEPSASPNSDYSYYLLSRSGTSGNFNVINNINYKIEGKYVVFTISLSALSNNKYYTVGWSNSGPGNCLDLDGTDDYISLNNLSASLAAGNATFEGWFQAKNDGEILFAINTSSGGNKCMLSRNRIWDKTANARINHSNPVTDTLWHHYALVIEANDSIKVYIDGALANSFSSSALSLTSTNQISIGQEWDGLTTSQHLEGKVDEVRIWNDIRTQEEVNDNMFTTLLGSEAGLVSYYKFDQSTESYLPDVAANTNQGTLVDFALSGTTSNWVTSTTPIVSKANAQKLIGPGNALDLAGDDDVVNLTSILDPSAGDWSFEAWIYPEDLSNTYHVLLSQKNGTGTGETYLTFDNGKPRISLGTYKIAPTALSTNKWFHVALTYDQSETKQTLYLDGIKLLELDGAIAAADGILVLGRNKYGSNYFNGKIDDLRFWSSCRTQTEIQDNMYASLNGNETNLLAYYNFNHSSGSVLEDITGNGNDGTLKNFSGTYWKSAASREPFKTVRAGSQGSGSTWKGGIAPNSNSDKLAVFHDLTLGSTGTYSRLQVNSGNAITTNADINITGEVIINGTVSGSNKIIMNGSAKQCLGGSGTMGALQINNSNDVSLEGDLTVSGALTLTSGDIELNDHDLTITGAASHGSSSSYLKINGNGRVKTTVGSDPVIIPIGRNPYLPVIIDNGNDAEFTIGVANHVYDNPETQNTLLNSNEVTETWTIEASQATNDVIVQIGWEASQEASGFDRAKAGIGFWETGVSSAWDNNVSPSSATGSGPYFLSRSISFTGNSYFLGIGSGGSPLPVELTYFTAQWHETGTIAELNWQTAVEINNSQFEIQRSLDGQSWQSIGTIQGHGNTINASYYKYIDHLEDQHLKSETIIYYRLKQIDYNGEYEYSAIEILNMEQRTINGFQIWPNPTQGSQINLSKMGNYQLYSTQGVLLGTYNQVQSIQMTNIPLGTYIIKNESGAHQVLIRQ